jgi:hypothetical protein
LGDVLNCKFELGDIVHHEGEKRVGGGDFCRFQLFVFVDDALQLSSSLHHLLEQVCQLYIPEHKLYSKIQSDRTISSSVGPVQQSIPTKL